MHSKKVLFIILRLIMCIGSIASVYRFKCPWTSKRPNDDYYHSPSRANSVVFHLPCRDVVNIGHSDGLGLVFQYVDSLVELCLVCNMNLVVSMQR